MFAMWIHILKLQVFICTIDCSYTSLPVVTAESDEISFCMAFE